MVENSVLFLSFTHIQKVMRQVQNVKRNEDLSLASKATAGAIAGAIVSFVLTPVELIKCQMQIQKINGTVGLFVNVIKTHGLRGLYRGHLGTFLREVAGGAAWFGVYEANVQFLLNHSNGLTQKSQLTPLQLMGAGAMAGMAYNAALFPADVIKSRQQTCINSKIGFNQIAKSLWRNEGWRGFYRGFGITIARSGPSSGIIFLTYEMMIRYSSS